MAEGRLEKLPKWAQEEIKKLRRELDDRDKTITSLTGKTPLDEAYVMVGRNDSNNDMPFPRGTGVQFVLTPKGDKHRAEEVQVDVLTDRDGKRHLRILGDRPLSLRPTSSNGFELRLL